MKERLIGLVARHGQTGLNADNCYRSWVDVPLNQTGIDQAHAAAGFLKQFPLRQVITSPLLRAFVTADIQAAPHKVPVSQHRGLFPWRLGFFSGMPKQNNQTALRLFVKNPEIAIPGGESLGAFEDRQYAFWGAALKLARVQGLTLYVAHTSNIVALENFTEDNGQRSEPEDSETVKPGGVAAIYWNGKNHRVEPVFGEPEDAKFGGS